jgi:hypothetical protein
LPTASSSFARTFHYRFKRWSHRNPGLFAQVFVVHRACLRRSGWIPQMTFDQMVEHDLALARAEAEAQGTASED